MSKSDKYQRFAEECLEIAQTAKDNQAKAVLLHGASLVPFGGGARGTRQRRLRKGNPINIGPFYQPHLPILSKLPPFLSEYADGARSRFGIQRAIRIVPQTRDIELTFPYGN
jgi:hypothetical protein